MRDGLNAIISDKFVQFNRKFNSFNCKLRGFSVIFFFIYNRKCLFPNIFEKYLFCINRIVFLLFLCRAHLFRVHCTRYFHFTFLFLHSKHLRCIYRNIFFCINPFVYINGVLLKIGMQYRCLFVIAVFDANSKLLAIMYHSINAIRSGVRPLISRT